MMKGEDFLSVSNRGRMAFFLCCAEQALAFESQTAPMHPRWSILINQFWQTLNWENVDNMEGFYFDYTPKAFKDAPATYADYLQMLVLREQEESDYTDETEYLELKLIFSSNSMIIPFLNSMDQYYVDGIYGASDEPHTVKLIDRFLSYIETNNLTLPPVENFKQFARTGDFNFGAPITREMVFNGHIV